MFTSKGIEHLPSQLQSAVFHSGLSFLASTSTLDDDDDVQERQIENKSHQNMELEGRNTPNLTIYRPEGSLFDVIANDAFSDVSSTKISTTSVCNLVSLQPFSIEWPQNITTTTAHSQTAERIFKYQYESAFAIAMAVEHLNSGDGSIVDELYTLHERTPCGGNGERGIPENPLRFVTEFVNTQSDPGIAVDQVVQVIARNDGRYHGNVVDGTTNNHRFGPCAFLGEVSELVTSQTSVYTGHKGYTQATGKCDHCTSIHMDDRMYYPKFVRTIPDMDSIARAFLSFLLERNFMKTTRMSNMEEKTTMMGMPMYAMMGERLSESEESFENFQPADRFLAVIHVSNDKYLKEAVAVQEAVKQVDPTLKVQNLSLKADGSNVVDVVSTLKELKFGFVYAIFGYEFEELMNDVMIEAYKQGVAGERTLTAEGVQTHNWFFSPIFMGGAIGKLRFPDPHVGKSESREAMLYKAYRGAGMIWVGGAGIADHVKNHRFDSFHSKLMNFRDEHMDEFESMVPLYGGNQTSFLREPSFLNPLIDDRAQFSYEATIMMGLAACHRAAGVSNRTEDLGTFATGWTLDGDNFYDEILQTSFQSISGDRIMLNTHGTRKANSTYFKIINFYDVEPDGTSTSLSNESVVTSSSESLFRFQMNPTDYYHNGAWMPIQPFVFSDGTIDTPRDSSVGSSDLVGVSQGVCIITLMFAGVAVSLSLICIAWTFVNWKTRVVRASQPFFLYLICTGAMMLALAIVPLSKDHTDIISRNDYTASCTATIWMVSLGFTTIFLAFFSKTYRINKIMDNARHFKRIKVRVVDTLVPMVILLTCNVMILTTMTILDPLEFESFTISEDRFGRPTKEYRGCDFASHYEYIGPLLVLNLAVLLFAMFQAWRARHLSTEFAETQYLFLALFSIVLVSFIGVPILLLVQSSPNASHFISSAILFVSSIAIQLFLFVPKYNFLKKGDGFAHSSRTSLSTATSPHHHHFQYPHDHMHTSSREVFDASSKSHGIENHHHPIGDGEVILSTQTPRELAKEVASLRRRLHVYEAQQSTREVDEGRKCRPAESNEKPVDGNTAKTNSSHSTRTD